MAKRRVNITNNSIRSGVTTDAKKAICEYIWNGFDAHAKHVEIEYTANKIGTILDLKISDDGEGINRTTLSETFGRYQDSVKKKSFQWSSQVKGHKGKGRYAFNCFATEAKWTSVFKEGDNLLEHTLSISAEENDQFNDHSDDNNQHIVNDRNTGTIVKFFNVRLHSAFFESDDFLSYLQKEFAVFLKLNENQGYSLCINGVAINCNEVIAESDSKEVDLHDDKNGLMQHFTITFIRWYDKMKENYCIYYLNEEGIERYEETTKLNKKDTGFHHSIYVSSPYFEHFAPSTKAKGENEEIEQRKIDFIEEHVTASDKDKVFKKLRQTVVEWLFEKEKYFISEVGGKELWSRFENNGVVELPKNEYEEPLFAELKETVIGIYSVQPKIFTNLGKDQAKALIGCVKLLLQTDKRDDIITILDGITKMSDEERHRLAQILETTELSNITKTIDLLENRLKIVSALKAMVFDESLQAYEVADVQRIVQSAFWLFGEQYNIVTEAEPDFQQALEQYLAEIHKEITGVSKSKINEEKIKHPDVNKEMDIFAFRQNKESHSLENIVIELKRPNVYVGEVEVSQIKNYMRLIYQVPQFNSTSAKWTFILVGKEYDSSGCIEGELESNKVWGKTDLIQRVDTTSQHYEIYVKKWSTLFDDFEIRHKFLLDKLNFKRKELTAKYITKQDLHNIVDQAKNNC